MSTFLWGSAITFAALVVWLMAIEAVFRYGGVLGLVLSALAYSAVVAWVLLRTRRDG